MCKPRLFWVLCMTVLLIQAVMSSTKSVSTKTPEPPCPDMPVNCTCSAGFPIGGKLYHVMDCSHRVVDLAKHNYSVRHQYTLPEGRLKEVPSRLCDMTPLTSLSISRNAIERLPDDCFPRLRNLIEFYADGNSISTLQDGLFDGLWKLEVISLTDNKIITIGLHTFSTLSNLSSLRNINLRDNNLAQVDTWPFILAEELPNFSVSLYNNYIKKFTNKQKWTYHSGRINNFQLDLGGNRIGSYDSLAKALNFTDLNDTVSLFSKIKIFLKGNDGYRCDCVDFDLHVLWRSLKTSNRPKILSIQCSNINNKEALTVPLEYFLCNIDYMCPEKCQCVNQPSNSTFHILCAKSGFTDIPITITPLNIPNSLFIQNDLTKYKLDFSGNNISSFQAQDYIQNASIVDLSSSGLKNITDEAIKALEKVDKIYFHNNLLITLPKIIATVNLTFTTLSFYNNPLSCDCDQVWLKHWLIQVFDHLVNPNSIQCNTPTWLRGRVIFSVNDTEFCSFPTDQRRANSSIQTIAISMVLCMSVIMLSLIIISFFRVKVYTNFGIHPFDRDECEGEEMLYDVFILFAHGDSQQARKVLKFLETHSLRVCFHERDFIVGDTILENIDRAINGSKRVLCLVSEYFISSLYCLEEFERALHHHITLKRRRLIVMMSEQYEIPLELDEGLTHQDADTATDDSLALLETQQNVIMPMLPKEDARRAVMIHNFVTRNTYIRLQSDGTSWQPQLLYAMPLKRLGLAPTNNN